MEYISLSVHGLVDDLFRVGDIDSRVFNSDTMQEGTRLHGMVQRSIGAGYRSEVLAEGDVEEGEFVLHLHGRADLVFDQNGVFRVEEIKSTVDDLEHFHEENAKWHLAQAICYAYLLSKEGNKEKADIRLYYLSQKDGSTLFKDYSFAFGELEREVRSYVGLFAERERSRRAHRSERDASLAALPFPYLRKRPGQERMEEAVEAAIEGGSCAFIEAPTGIGKTISSLFPSLKAFPKNGIKKIFYLTAKQSGQASAASALCLLQEMGAKLSYSKLDSKERMCRVPGANCNPDECPFAKGYYGKLPAAREAARSFDGRLDREAIDEIADGLNMCPFELQLDLSEDSDVIVGDYNYLFDPLVALERYFSDEGFGEQGDYVALVDEAHNLVERGRDIYGALFSFSEVKAAYDDLLMASARKARIKGTKAFLDALEEAGDSLLPGDSFLDYESLPASLDKAIQGLVEAERSIAASNLKKAGKPAKRKPLPPSYRSFLRKVRRASYLLENVAGLNFFISKEDGDLSLRLMKLDPSSLLKATVEKLRSVVFFSATFSPIDYYMNAILGRKDESLVLPSPFPRENFYLAVAPVSTRYRDRERTYPYVAAYLSRFVKEKRGNCFLFFPSYGYLRAIRPYLDLGDIPVYEQEKGMSSARREEFLSHFQIGGEGVGLLVLGGPFAEGIDLADERLGAVAVVGVGFPQVSHERDLIRSSRLDPREGYLFAYVYPGINKVMQAMGRLIRSEKDVGAFLLIDDRYRGRDYSSLFSGAYRNPLFASSPEAMERTLASFLKKEKKV